VSSRRFSEYLRRRPNRLQMPAKSNVTQLVDDFMFQNDLFEDTPDPADGDQPSISHAFDRTRRDRPEMRKAQALNWLEAESRLVTVLLAEAEVFCKCEKKEDIEVRFISTEREFSKETSTL
jgi:hypothetical protein